eukprot:m.141915 g.141915  ORF g.141915 m.141915 type:complete len:168 (+) comp38350_c1_seq31:438-941(+)
MGSHQGSFFPLATAVWLLLAVLLVRAEDLCNVTAAERSDLQLQLMNESGCSKDGNQMCTAGCCPQIVKPNGTQPGGTQIEALSVCRGVVECIVQAGSCPVTNKFQYEIDWGDGVKSTNTTAALQPFQVVHTFSSCPKSYAVKITYCPVVPAGETPCCDNYCKTIEVS